MKEYLMNLEIIKIIILWILEGIMLGVIIGIIFILYETRKLLFKNFYKEKNDKKKKNK